MNANIVLISNDAKLRDSIASTLSRKSFDVYFLCSLTRDLQEVRAFEPSIIFYHQAGDDDSRVPELIQFASSCPHQPAVVVICDSFDPARAVEVLQLGAADYLSRPLDLSRLAMSADFMTWRFRHPVATQQPSNAAQEVRRIGREAPFFYGEELSRIIQQAEAIAPLNTTVLLTGETGVGKTRLARLIHDLSLRGDRPFITVNCGALTPSLLESELFGHVKNAFTGAEEERAGRFLAAKDGTLVLDDVDSLSLEAQAKLLRAVDERVFEPVGSDKSLPVTARFLVATNRNLEEEVAAGRFRLDLLYRINVITLELPPLRERTLLIPTLTDQLIASCASHNGQPAPRVSAEAMDKLVSYDWPGNIRELRNVVERMVAFCTKGVIDVYDLPESIYPDQLAERSLQASRPPQSKLMQAAHEAESSIIRHALAKNDNNRSRAALDLGISRVTLYKKLRKYRIA